MTSVQAYSRLDRLLHRTAFSNKYLQITAADIEKALFGRTFRNIPIDRPVFVSSLPRAGTTLLLELLTQSGAFASHCYRDMPMIMAPVLWSRLSAGFRQSTDLRERAHGDGMQVGYDSPEAFEEVLWRAFWPRKFRGGRISLWSSSDSKPEFEEFFVEHVKRLIAVRSGDANEPMRYVSKNNANIARIGYLRRLFPDCIQVVPFREPLAQADSLLRQHIRFGAMHREDPFTKTYMRDIGHLEFGELHQPLDFEAMADVAARFDPSTLDYWLGYWTAAFRSIIAQQDQVVLLSYERLCEEPGSTLESLAARLHVGPEGLVELKAMLRAPPPAPTVEVADPSLLGSSRELHGRLLELSLA